MPIRNVSRFFTLEQQRQEINLIGDDIGNADTLNVNGTTNIVDAINLTYSALVSAEAGVIGNPTDGSYTDDVYAVYLSNTTTVADAVDGINTLLGRILPESPPVLSTYSVDLESYLLYRYCSGVTGLDNGILSIPGAGSTIKVTRTSSYQTEPIVAAGPGNTGTLSVNRNNTVVGTVDLDNNDNSGTYGELFVSNNVDYSNVVDINPNIWYSYDVYAAGNSTNGWNNITISHLGESIPSIVWLYDTANPGSPTLSSTIIEPATSNYNYSSGIPHFTQSNSFEVELTMGKLSGNVFPLSNEFITINSSTAFNYSTPITYANVGIATPLPSNYLSSTTENYTVTLPIRDTHLSSSNFPQFVINNGYQTTTHTPSYNKTILIKGGTSSTTKVDEQNIVISEEVGTGSGNGFRVSSKSNSDNPSDIWSATTVNFNTQFTISTYEATVVGGVLKHDQTNYSVNYIPTGPNLSSGRTGSQYFTFKFNRQSVSNFPIQINSSTGISGLWITSNISNLLQNNTTTNGWITPTEIYSGYGVPVNGCALENTLSLNTSLNNTVIYCTFGSENSSSSLTNDIFVRVKLSPSQTVSFISISS